MSISVLNTDVGLSGKTLLNAESAQTITGAKTFDLDPSPPFIVASGSAVVTNLDADKLDGSEGSSYVHKTNDLVWTDRTFNAANYTASAGNWVLTSPDVLLDRYIVAGKVLKWHMTLSQTSPSAPAASLRVTIPSGGFASSNEFAPVAFAQDNAVIVSAYAQVINGTTLGFFRTDGTPWSASANGTYIYFNADLSLA